MTACIHKLFEAQAEATPHNTALVFEDEQMSYAELNARANQLAHALQDCGVGVEDCVRLCIERSFEMIIGILGILKSGAAYAPIDAGYPATRINYLFDDLHCPVVLTQAHLKDSLPTRTDSTTICLDSEWERIASFPNSAPETAVQPENLAVVLYTSGSTGSPKGVLMEHRSVATRLLWDREKYQQNERDIVLQHATITFDFSLLEILTALINGGTLVLARPNFAYNSHYLIDLLQRQKVSKLCIAPSLFELIVDTPGFEDCTDLKQVFIGGEPLTHHLQETFFKHSSGELINIYGPTEVTISTLNWQCQRNSEDRVVPIGHPTSGVKIYLLDGEMRPVADGEVGEIFVSGITVTRGYHNLPDLTAASFLPDHDGGDGKMYRTGDLARKLPSGAYEFLGRKDFQVKIRGLRVELGEIEFHLREHPQVKNCVVHAFRIPTGSMRLAGYIIPNEEVALDMDDLRTYLAMRLPDYMVPGIFIAVDAFALTPNGKIDRKALPIPNDVRVLAGTSYHPPLNDIERQLVTTWEEVLQLSPIGVKDDFLSLGGDSLAAMEIFTHTEEKLGVSLPLASFANSATIQGQARLILEQRTSSQSLFWLRREGEKTPLVLIGGLSGVLGSLTSYQGLIQYLEPGHPVLLVAWPQNSDAPPESIQDAANYFFEVLQDEYPRHEYIIAGYSARGLVALHLSQLLISKEVSVPAVILFDTWHPELIRISVEERLLFHRLRFGLHRALTGSRLARVDAIRSIFTDIEWRLPPIFQSFLKWNQRNVDRQQKAVIKTLEKMAMAYSVPPIEKTRLVLFIACDQYSPESVVERWRPLARSGIRCVNIPGRHSTLFQEPYIRRLAHEMNEQVLRQKTPP